MTEGDRIFLQLHGVPIEVQSGHTPFLSFVGEYFREWLSPERRPEQIKVRMDWMAAAPPVWNSDSVKERGRRLLQLRNCVLQRELETLPGLEIAACWNDGHLEIHAYYRPRSHLASLAASLEGSLLGGFQWGSFSFHALMRRLYAVLGYYLIYFPLIHYLEQTRGWQLLHAAAVGRPDGASLLVGLPGSGKTTLALALLADPLTMLLSENLLMYDEQTLYALPEPIRVGRDVRNLLPMGSMSRIVERGNRTTYSRLEHRLVEDTRLWQARPRKLYVLGFAGRLECQPLGGDAALSQVLAFDRMAREYNAYKQFQAGLQVIAPRRERSVDRGGVLGTLLAPLQCYELWLEKGHRLDQVVRWMGE